jgi:hypothetical protein
MGNMKKVTEKITRNYIFTQKELKEKLGMKGNIEHVELWSGAYQYEATKETETKDKNEWEIVTTEQSNLK